MAPVRPARGAIRRAGIAPLHIALIGVLLTYVWRVQDLFPALAPFKVPTIATGIAAALLVIDSRVGRQLRLATANPVWTLIPWFVAAAAVSVVFSIELGWSLDFFVRSFVPSVALALVVPAAVYSPRDARLFASVQVVGACLYAGFILSEFDVGASGRLGRLVFYDANDLGLLLVCTLPLCVHFIRFGRRAAWRGLAFASALLFIVGIARTGSRGAFLGLLTIAVYLLVQYRTVRATTRLTLAGALAVTLLVGAGDRYWDMMATLLDPSADYNWAGRSDGGRMNIWKRGFGYLADRPVTGVGLWAFPVAEGTLSTISERQEYGRGVKWSAAHNSFVQVAAELGVPGLILFCGILWRGFRTASRLARDARASAIGEVAEAGALAQAHAASLLGYAVSGFFLSQAYAPYLFFVLGMIIGLDVSARQEWTPAGRGSEPARRVPTAPRRRTVAAHATAVR